VRLETFEFGGRVGPSWNARDARAEQWPNSEDPPALPEERERQPRAPSAGSFSAALHDLVTKYRLGEEPDAVVLEVDLTSEPWQLRDVTADLEAAGQAARAARQAERQSTREKAAAALLEELAHRTAAGAPELGKAAAETILRGHGLTRRAAHELLRKDGRRRLGADPSDKRKVIVGP
jgi:hypothetical protein